MNKYIIKLTDEDDNSIHYYEVETEKSLEEVKKVYNDARNEWYEDCAEFDCLSGHIDSRLEDAGIYMYEIEADLELDF